MQIIMSDDKQWLISMIKFIYSDAQNFYLLKIHLNLFEISNRVLEF